MLENFFQLGPVPKSHMVGFYNINLIILSYLVATFASYIALDMTARIRDVNNSKLGAIGWLLGGSVAMGAGIWSMHFIGMLAFTMPGMSISYDFFWTGLSMIVAILASGFAFLLLKPLEIRVTRLILGGIILGLSIASMHYLGMEAMQINVNIHYIFSTFMYSILIAIIASEAALYLALKSNQVIASMRTRLKVFSAFIMGTAICGMHYTGMAAAVFTPIPNSAKTISLLNPEILSISIAGVTFIILGIAFFASSFREAENRRLLANARQAGMAEVAASVLHNVGNVLNSINISSTIILEKISSSKISELNSLYKLIKETDDLSTILKNNKTKNELLEFIKLLFEECDDEKQILQNETKRLVQNIDHIKDIIAIQQNLSKISQIKEIISIPNTLDEALFITGIETNNPEIKIIKEYSQLDPVLIDKVKLLQILVNLLSNAKDALIESSQQKKQIILKICKKMNEKFIIAISDNGIGILLSNTTRIFSYGFTTKKHGHGFGLHSSALAAKEIGGLIKVTSEGLNQGATFILELPYKLPK